MRLWCNSERRILVFWICTKSKIFSHSNFVRLLCFHIIQLSKIVGCKLTRQGSLPFTANYPSCNTFLHQTPKVLICFGNFPQICHTFVFFLAIAKLTHWLSFDGENYESSNYSRYGHGFTFGLANYKGKALTTGCYYDNYNCGLKTELLDLITLRWSMGPDFPFSSQ